MKKTEDISELKIVDIGDFVGKNRTELFKNVEDKVCEIVKNNKFFKMIGGDHSTTIPVQKGIDKVLSEPFELFI